MKYLGFHSDHIGGDQRAFEITKDYMHNAAVRLIHCHAPKEAKLLIYRMQIVPKVMYMATKACWSLAQYKELDKYAARILKHIGNQMPTSANIMMFFPAEMCGSGLHTISDLAQAQKWGEIARSLDAGNEASDAACGLLERAMRQTVQQAPPTQYRTILYRNLQYLKGYAGSLVEWGDSIGHCLTNSSSYEYTDSNKAILPFLSNDAIDEQLIKQLQKKDITVQGELVQHLQNGSLHWSPDTTTMLMRERLGVHLIRYPTDQDLMFNSGQMYIITGNEDGSDILIEVIGIVTDSNLLQCYVWIWANRNNNIISRSMNHELAIIFINLLDLSDKNFQRIVTVPYNRGRSKGNSFMRSIVSCTDCSAPSLGIKREFRLPDDILYFAEWVSGMSIRHNCAYSLFTDGSCRDPSTIPFRGILWSESQKDRYRITSSAIIAIADSDNWNEYGCGVLYLQPSTELTNYGMNAYNAELVALIIAVQIQRIVPTCKIYSDCKGAIETVLTASTPGAKKSGLCTIRPLISSLKLSHHQRPCIEWVPSHPERRKAQEFWNYKDWGIYIADLAAGGDYNTISENFYTELFEISINAVLSGIVLPGEWFWTDGDSQVPYTSSEISLHAQESVHNYLLDRDNDRENRGEDARWLGTSLSIANKCWRTIAKGIIGSNIILKNVLDKYWHGRNRAKNLIGQEAAKQLACKLCGADDSQEHILLECVHPELCEIREEAFINLRHAVEHNMRQSKDSHTYHRRIMRFILAKASDIEYYHVVRLWTGTWNVNVLWHAICFDADREEINHIKHETAMEIQELIIGITKVLTKATHEMMRCRIQTERDLDYADESIWSAPPTKRSRTKSYTTVVVESGFLSKSETKCKNKNKKKISTNKAQKRQELVRQRRGLCEDIHSRVNMDEAVLNCCNMDVVGYVSHPHGETEDCDYDRD